MTNTKNFNRLIDRIKVLEVHHNMQLKRYDEHYFTMSYYEYACGAPACMAGHGKHLFRAEVETGRTDQPHPAYVTAEALGLESSWAIEHLFTPATIMEVRKRFVDLTPEEACRALERVRDAGDNYRDLTIRDIWS